MNYMNMGLDGLFNSHFFDSSVVVGIVSSLAVLAGVFVKGVFDTKGRREQSIFNRLDLEIERLDSRVTELEEKNESLERELFKRENYIAVLRKHIHDNSPPPPPIDPKFG